MTVVLIGVGNPWRGDDGVGWVVVDAAAPLLDGVAVVQTDGEPSRLIDAWSGCELAVVVDAMRGRGVPGEVRVWDGAGALAATSPRGSSHALGIGDAVALAAALGRLPTRLVIVGVEVRGMTQGHGLTAEVAAAVPRAARTVVELVQAGSKATSSAAE